MSDEEINKPSDFIREAVAEDLKNGRFNYVRTRLPPEPNGYLHIGHVKAFLIDYFTAKEFGGELILRFDDTNPSKEETEFVEAIEDDTRWLGVEWVKVTFASDYFDLLYEWAQKLVLMGKAYVDDQTQEEVKANRGTLTTPGKNSPFRERDVEENMDLLERMKNGAVATTISSVSPRYKSDAVAIAPPPTCPLSAVGGPMNEVAVTSVNATMI